MAEKIQIGICWGADQLYFVVLSGSEIVKSFSIPLPLDKIGDREGSVIPSAMQLISDIQRKLSEEGITPTHINLSLPLKDIIFRSFVIPRMQSSEIKSAVDFEASKYVPFALKDLAYAFQPITISEDKTKRIRVIFAAIKKDSLNQYTDVLEQTELESLIVEPEASSLIRALSFKKLLNQTQTIALVEKNDDIGKIVVLDKEIPQFVREFQLKSPSSEQNQTDQNALTTKLINEIRISLDYFNRQSSQSKITKILLLAHNIESNLPQQIEENLGIPIDYIQPSIITNDTTHTDFGYIKAFGVGLVDVIGASTYFDFLKRKTKSIKITRHKTSGSEANFKTAIITGVVCALVLATTFLLTEQLMLAEHKKEIKILRTKLDDKADVTLKSIKEDIDDIQIKHDTFKNIRLTSNISSLLILIPDLLPDGSWLEKISISFPDTKLAKTGSKKIKKKATIPTIHTPTILLSGYVYSEQFTKQFDLVNQCLQNLKENKNLNTQFHYINLDTVNAKKLGKHAVTFYKITLK